MATLCMSILMFLILRFAQAQKEANSSFGDPCLTSADCARPGSCGQDFCFPSLRICIYTAETDSCPQAIPLISRQELLDAVNADDSYDLSARVTLIDLARRLLHEVHPHRLLHLNLLGIDPVVVFDQLRMRVAAANDSMTNAEFHDEMITAFAVVNDRHTVYNAPFPLALSLAYLPFTIADYYESDSHSQVPGIQGLRNRRNPQILVSDLASGFTPSKATFQKGVQVVEWNGLPILEALQEAGEACAAANSAAKFRLGLSVLTSRFLKTDRVPDRKDVTVGYVGDDGLLQYITLDWLYLTDPSNNMQMMSKSVARNIIGVHEEISPAAGKRAFRTRSKDEKQSLDLGWTGRSLNVGERLDVPVNESLKEVFTAEIVRTSSGLFGRIRIFTFQFHDIVAFYDEYTRLLELLPSEGLVLDVRGNLGGQVFNSYTATALVGDGTYTPATSQFRVTNTIAELTNAKQATNETQLRADRFSKSANFAQRIGDTFTTDLPFISISSLSDFFGDYERVTVVLTDGASYSAADLTAAAVIDNKFGAVVGVADDRSGGGGSVVGSYNETLRAEFPDLFPVQLPGDVDIDTSLARVLRVGEYKGLTFEYVGVEVDEVYYPTKADRLDSEVELLEFVGKTLTRVRMEKESDPEPSMSPEEEDEDAESSANPSPDE